MLLPLTLLAALLLVLLGALLLVARQTALDPIAEFRARAHAEFASQAVTSRDPRFSFYGKNAVVVQDREEVGRADEGQVISHTLTRYARNPAGEYFLFICMNGTDPYVKHVSQSIAKLVLKQAYIAPNGDA